MNEKLTPGEYKLQLQHGDTWNINGSQLPSVIPLECGFSLVELTQGEEINLGDFWYHLGEFKRFDHQLTTRFLGLFPRKTRYGDKRTARIYRLEYCNR